MATRCAFENSDEVGVFAALTNAYCLTGRYKEIRTLMGGTGSSRHLR
jgi:translation initiation factor 6 (eIF-6)